MTDGHMPGCTVHLVLDWKKSRPICKPDAIPPPRWMASQNIEIVTCQECVIAFKQSLTVKSSAEDYQQADTAYDVSREDRFFR